MIVPELPPEIREFKERVGRFVEEEAYPLEQRIAERGSIDSDEVEALRDKAREAGLAMLNMPPENGGIGLSMLGQVAIEEESGKATNGLGSRSSTAARGSCSSSSRPRRPSGSSSRSCAGISGKRGH